MIQGKKDRGKLDSTLAAMFSNQEYRVNYLFYAHMIGQCSIKMDDQLPAPAGVSFIHDHYNLYINQSEFDKFPLVQRLGILKHEMLHILFGHVDRGSDKVHKPWNYSTDCAINQLIESGHLPEWVITPENLGELIGVTLKKNESSEYYYEAIKSKAEELSEESGKSSDSEDSEGSENSDDQESSKNGKPKVLDSHEKWDDSQGDSDLQKDVTKRMIEKSQNETIKGAGSIPVECSDWLNLHSSKSEFNWKKILRGIVGNKKVGKRTTIMRSDRRFPDRDDLRGKLKDRTFNLLVIADVSGSMSDQAVVSTLAEVRHICDVTKTNVDLIQVDTQAYKPEKLTKSTSIISRKGCGGTYLNPALELAKTHGIDFQAVVVLTDGGLFGDDLTYFESLGKKVIWLIESTGTILPGMENGRMRAFKLSK